MYHEADFCTLFLGILKIEGCKKFCLSHDLMIFTLATLKHNELTSSVNASRDACSGHHTI